MTAKKALLFGGSGFIGSFLTRELLHSPDYAQVTMVVRKDPGLEHAKLNTVMADYDALPEALRHARADEAFIAIGTTKKKTPDLAEYYKIDHDYVVRAAALAKERGATSVFLVSAVGASVNSCVFYNRTKGDTERDVIALKFAQTHIFRPSIIMGERPEHRPLEKALITACKVFNPMLSGLRKKYRGMEAKDIARAMLKAAARQDAGAEQEAASDQEEAKVILYHWEDMRELL